MSVHKSADGKSWYVRYRDEHGHNRQESNFARKTGPGGAQEFDEEIKRSKRRGISVSPDGPKTTIGEFYEQTFEPLRLEGRHETRWLPKRGEVGIHHVGRRWAPWRLGDVKREEVMRWHKEMRDAGCSDAQVWRSHDLLVAILGLAVALDKLYRHPALGLRPKYRPRRRGEPWGPMEIESIRARILAPPTRSERSRLRDATLVSVLGYCALRIDSEGRKLEWDRVLRTTLWIVDTKTGVDRSVPAVAPVLADLREWRLKSGLRSGLVFPDGGGGSWIAKVWKPALAAAGLEYQTPHFLRHSCISMWIASGLTLPAVAERAGHSQQTCLKTYAHAFADGRRDFDMEAAIHEARSPQKAADHG